jgi:arylsulfatase A-like enzyme
MTERPNIVVVVSDTLRTKFLGCYGNPTIHTPCLDAFADQSVRFTRAYPEALPTVPVRRGLHTGRRVYPFRDYKPVKWDIVYLPGWQALSEDQDTLAENVAAAGYHTGFVTDTLPYFAPAMNFTRGFWQWEFVRGQQQDRWKSPAAVSDERLDRYRPSDTEINRGLPPMYRQHVANTDWIKHEHQTSTARVFQWAMDFLEDNRRNTPFYLLVDCFDPHEPWEAPKHYYERYANPTYDGRTILHAPYDALETFGTEAELEDIVAHYSGLVTLVDTWFGKLMTKLESLGLSDNTWVIFASDHGTNFADNPEHVVGKPARALYPGVMHVPLMIRQPQRRGAGSTVDDLTYLIDIPATIYDLTGATPVDGLDGRSLAGCFNGQRSQPREYLTCRYSDFVWYRDDDTWVFCDLDGERRHVFDLKNDADCQRDIADQTDVARAYFARAWGRILADAGGALPDYRNRRHTEADGQQSVDQE